MRRARLGRLFILAALLSGCAARPLVTPAPPPARPGFVKKELDNGLVILCQENHATPVAVVQATVRAGSIFEGEYLGHGISHFCEHLVSGGSTATRSEEETEELLDLLGGANNAYTSTDRTTYFIRTTRGRNFETACDLIADWMQNAAFKQAEFDRERKVIQREIEKGDTEPNRVVWKLAARTMFSFHPARHPVIGHKPLFLKLTRDDVVKYYRRMYRPDNMVVVAVGDFDAAKTADRIAGLFQDAERSGRLPHLPVEDPPQQGRRSAVTEMDVRAAYAILGFRTVPLSHPDLYPLDVMSYVLSRGTSSRLVQRLRETDRLVDSVTSWSYTPWYGAGNFCVKMVLKPEQMDAARAAALDELNRLKHEPVSEAELARAKKQKVAAEVFHAQTVEDRAADLAGNYLATGNPFFSEIYLRGIRRVTAEDVRRVARKYLTPENLTVAAVRPKAAAAEETAADRPPPSPVHKITLPNGLRVLIKRNPNAPLVVVKAFFLGGVLTEDERTAGRSHLLGQMLTRGTESRSALEISQAVDAIGGRLGGGSGNHTVFLEAQVLAEDLPRGIELVADCLLHPAFPRDDLEKVKQLTLHAIARRNDHWEREALDLLRETLYRTSPYRLDKLGTEASVKGLTRDDLAAFHRRACTGRNGVVAVFGDVDMERTKRLVAERFGSMPGGTLLATDVPADAPMQKDVTATKKARRPETAVVSAAYRTCTMGDVEDRYALLVLDGVMSGIGYPGGWLHNDLRGKGLVYVVHAYNFLGLRTPGYFGMYALTRPEKVDEVRAVFDRHVARAKRELVDRDEFERAKKMAVTMELLGRQTNGAMATVAALDELYGFGYDFSWSFPERVRAVTREDLRRVARKYFTHKALAIVAPELEPDKR
jgi:zinc protease